MSLQYTGSKQMGLTSDGVIFSRKERWLKSPSEDQCPLSPSLFVWVARMSVSSMDFISINLGLISSSRKRVAASECEN